MRYKFSILLLLFLIFFGISRGLAAGAEDQIDTKGIIQNCWEHMRGRSSVSLAHMTIHRPDWERKMTIKAWTKGMENSLFKILAPPKDKGNGTLKKGDRMWTYNPKVNRVIKIPPSMMSQAWMGSDFSNNDLAKSDSIVEDYEHSLLKVLHSHGHKIYVIKAVPKAQAPVVWGMQKLRIREDGILLQEIFYDQDLQAVKILSTSEIQMMDDRLLPRVWKMRKTDQKQEYTLVEYENIDFKQDLPGGLFTLGALRTKR